MNIKYFVGAKETLNLVLASEGDRDPSRRMSEFRCYASIVVSGTEKGGTETYNIISYRTSNMYPKNFTYKQMGQGKYTFMEQV